MVKFGGKIGTLYQMLKNAFKKHPLQNRTNVQIKGGGAKGLLNNVQKNCTFLKGWLPLFQLHNLRKERVINCLLTLCAINVHLGDSCALGILLHWEYLGNPFTVLPPFALSMDRQPCGKRHRLCQCQKRENHQKHYTCR